MCARYTLAVPDDQFQEHFELLIPPGLSPRFNIAPSQPVAVVGLKPDGSARGLVPMTWGFVPRWATDPRSGPRPVNAKAETVRTSPPFRDSFRDRRCLLPATGFFEWETVGKEKVPYLFRPAAGGVMAFAGLWDVWKPKGGGDPLFTCAVITVPANDVVRPLHDRMPAILPRERYADWLNPKATADEAFGLLRPAADGLLERVRVNRAVNNSRIDTPECVQAG
jgi:putative SOS response-associated peptidase YedK